MEAKYARAASFLELLHRILNEALEPYSFQAAGRFELEGVKEFVMEGFPDSEEATEAFCDGLIERLNEAADLAFMGAIERDSPIFSLDFRGYKNEIIREIGKAF